MKKTLSVLVCLAFVLCMGAGVLAAEPTKITWAARNFSDARGLIWTSWAEEFEKLHPDVNIEPTVVSSYNSTIATWVASGNAPDIAWMGVAFYEYADQLVDLSDLYKNDKDIHEIMPQMIAAHSFEGKLLAIPYGANVHATFYNKDMTNAAGITINKGWTWDDAITYGKRLSKDTNGDGTSEVWGLNFYEDTHIWGYGNGVPFGNGGRTVTINNPVTIDAFEMWWDLTKVQTNINKVVYAGSADIINGVVAMGNRGVFDIPLYRAQTGIDWDVAELPWLESGGNKYYTTFYSPETWTIFKQSKNQDVAKEFVRFIMSKEKMTQIGELGGIIPTQPSVAVRSFLASGAKPTNIRVFTDTLAYWNGATDAHPARAILRPIWLGDYWSQMKALETPANIAIPEMAKMLQAELDNWWAARDKK